ncbi:MAG: serine/threonine-protein kinase [Planctomycetia bacterium]|nr:serine/threonine-protein kinase [Planctomycetia bacterium]
MALNNLGRYRLLNSVNTGADTQIWQGRDDRNECFVAIKTLTDKRFADKKEAAKVIAMLRQEYTVGGKMDHPNVIHILDFAEEDVQRPFLVMEWFPAGNLKKLVREGLDTYAWKLPDILRKMAEGVAYFNAQGWVHRDIKPDNFVLNDNGELKLIDFAISVRAQGMLAKLFGKGNSVQGTRSYMSPEQIRGQALDQRADIYSLACTFFEMVTGQPPFTGTTSNELLHKHLNTAPPPVDVYNKNITPEFTQLIKQSLAKKPADRPPTSNDFLTKLKTIRIFKRNPVAPQIIVQQKEGN